MTTKCKQRPKLLAVIFQFRQISLENGYVFCIWHCIKMFIRCCRTYLRRRFRNKGTDKKNNIKWWKMSLFWLKIGDFSFFNLQAFLLFFFFKQITQKVIMEKYKWLLLSCREYLILGTEFVFFHLFLIFLNYQLKRAKIFIVCKKITILAPFIKNSKNIRVGEKTKTKSKTKQNQNKTKQKPFLDTCLNMIFQ